MNYGNFTDMSTNSEVMSFYFGTTACLSDPNIN